MTHTATFDSTDRVLRIRQDSTGLVEHVQRVPKGIGIVDALVDAGYRATAGAGPWSPLGPGSDILWQHVTRCVGEPEDSRRVLAEALPVFITARELVASVADVVETLRGRGAGMLGRDELERNARTVLQARGTLPHDFLTIVRP